MQTLAFSTLKPLETLQEEMEKLGLIEIKVHFVESVGRQFCRFVFAQGENRVVICQMLTPKRALHQDPMVVVSGDEDFVRRMEDFK